MQGLRGMQPWEGLWRPLYLSASSLTIRACYGIWRKNPGKIGVSPMSLSHLLPAGLSFWRGTDAAFDEDTRTWPAA